MFDTSNTCTWLLYMFSENHILFRFLKFDFLMSNKQSSLKSPNVSPLNQKLRLFGLVNIFEWWFPPLFGQLVTSVIGDLGGYFKSHRCSLTLWIKCILYIESHRGQTSMPEKLQVLPPKLAVAFCRGTKKDSKCWQGQVRRQVRRGCCS